MSEPVLHPRHGTNICAKCRKPFKAGDRAMMVHIIMQTGFNGSTREVGSWFSEEFELAHAMCDNPALEGQIITVGR